MNATIDDVMYTPTTDPIHVFLASCAPSPVYILYCLYLWFAMERGHGRTLHSPLRVILLRVHLQPRLGQGLALGEATRFQCSVQYGVAG